ncbi:MAG: hypothetical protein JST49_05485 [Bacteroidetes bacterium]|nr:hypothetical protein [Bacteroidota bacterium]
MEEQPFENTLTPSSETLHQTCPICSAEYNTQPKFCSNCGYPINGTFDEQDAFDLEYRSQRASLEGALIIAGKARTALFVLSGLLLIGNGVIAYVQGSAAMFIVGICISAIFVGLGFWSKKKPFTALVTALVLYATIVLADAAFDPSTLIKGLLVKIIVITYLISGIKSAKEAQHIQDELNAKNWNQ